MPAVANEGVRVAVLGHRFIDSCPQIDNRVAEATFAEIHDRGAPGFFVAL